MFQEIKPRSPENLFPRNVKTPPVKERRDRLHLYKNIRGPSYFHVHIYFQIVNPIYIFLG
ncbi:MAG: hypothetical protein AB4352_20125 [Hormoscilla sp.]